MARFTNFPALVKRYEVREVREAERWELERCQSRK